MQLGTPSSEASERIVVVDVLRAFALFGIIINHSAMAFLAGPPPKPDFMIFSSLDTSVGTVVRLLTFGKFFAIFSFLFGLSFAIQLQNAAQKGKSFSGRFTWRLIILLAIGYVHGLFFSGDILLIYALLGLLLVPVQRFKNRTLLLIAVVLILNVPGLVLGLVSVNQPPAPEQQQLAAQSRAAFMQRAQRHYEVKKFGTAGDLMLMNAKESLQLKLGFQIATGRLWITYGLFLLGLYAGRMNLFRDSPANRALMRRVLTGAGVAALITSAIAVLGGPVMRPQTSQQVVLAFCFTIQQASLAAFFVAAITLLFWRKSNHALLSQLAPLGKMGLTTYLLQTVFGIAVFYGLGLGLLGELGIAACVGLGILAYIAQMYLARVWLGHFKLGPAEWLWRSLTYLQIQPNSRRQMSPA